MKITIKNLEGFQLANPPGELTIQIGVKGEWESFEQMWAVWKLDSYSGGTKSYQRDHIKIQEAIRHQCPEYFL